MKLKQVHIYHHPRTDSIALVRQDVGNPADSEAVDATAEFVHALQAWALFQHAEGTTAGGKLFDRVLWWFRAKVLRQPSPVWRTGRRFFSDGRGNSYNVIVEHCKRNGAPEPETTEIAE